MPIYLTHNNAGLEPGLSETDIFFGQTNLSNLKLPVQPTGVPLSVVPTTGAGSHTQTLFSFNNNLRTPYTQNFNFSIQRQLTGNTSLTLSYVGSKGSKLARSVDVNEVNVFENGLLNAFNIVQAGGTSPLIEQIFNPAKYPAVAAAGTGSNYVRTNGSTFSFIANNSPGGLANYISSTTALTGLAGGLLANAGLPANFVVANPQYLTSYYVGNFGNSSYHSLVVQVDRQLSHGLTLQGSYVWSKLLGDEEGDGSTLQSSFRTLRNFSLDKHLLSYNHTGVMKINGIYELPFGRGKLIGRDANGFLDRVIGGWQMGGIYNYYSGSPWTITAQNTLNNYGLANANEQFTPTALGALPSPGVSKLGSGAVLLTGFTQSNPVGLSTLRTISTGGSPLLVNPGPGQLGTLPLTPLVGPGANTIDVNLIKRVRITERVTLQVGATAQNLTNTPVFNNPTLANSNINSVNFGRITTNGATPRIIVLQGRVIF